LTLDFFFRAGFFLFELAARLISPGTKRSRIRPARMAMKKDRGTGSETSGTRPPGL